MPIKRDKKGHFKKGHYSGNGFKKGGKHGHTQKHTESALEKMRLHCGHPCSEETRDKIRKSLINKKRIGDKNSQWKGGKYLTKDGYVCVLIEGKYLLEHRYLVEKLIGRKLNSYEHIHHLNGIKNDNRIENLKLVLNTKHYGEIKCPKCQFEFLIK